MLYTFFLLFISEIFSRNIKMPSYIQESTGTNTNTKNKNNKYINNNLRKKNFSSSQKQNQLNNKNLSIQNNKNLNKNLNKNSFLEESIKIKENFSLALRVLRLEFEKFYEKKINEYRNKKNLKDDELYSFFKFKEFANFYKKKRSLKYFKNPKTNINFFEYLNNLIENKISKDFIDKNENYLEPKKDLLLIEKNKNNSFIVQLSKEINKDDLKTSSKQTIFKEIFIENHDYFLDLYFCYFLYDILMGDENSKIKNEIIKFLKFTSKEIFYIEDPSSKEKKDAILKEIIINIIYTYKYFLKLSENFFSEDLKKYLDIDELKKLNKSSLKEIAEKIFTVGFVGVSSYFLYKGLSNNFSLTPMDIAKKYYHQNYNFKDLKETIFEKGIPIVVPQVNSTIRYFENFLIKNNIFKKILLNPATRFFYEQGRTSILFKTSNVLLKNINKFSGNRFNFFENYPPTIMGFFIDPLIKSSIKNFSNKKKIKVFLKKNKKYKNILIINKLYSLIESITINIYEKENFNLINKYNKTKDIINIANIGMSFSESIFLNKK